MGHIFTQVWPHGGGTIRDIGQRIERMLGNCGAGQDHCLDADQWGGNVVLLSGSPLSLAHQFFNFVRLNWKAIQLGQPRLTR